MPATAFVNNIRADLFDANTVYVALDNHKYGDFKPYLYKSTNKGKTWKSITGNIPDRHLIWRMVQDHVKSDLLFAATEFGIYFTLDGGGNWMKLSGGAPTIAFRGITIQREWNDLVAASFGRGFFILDDISVLREIDEEKLKAEGTLFSTRQADWYSPRSIVSSQVSAQYAAPNPEFGATFTYYLSEGYTTMESERKKKEREAAKNGQDIPFPGWDALEAEKEEVKPQVFITIKDKEGNVVRRLNGRTNKGLHRINWDLMYASKRPVNPSRAGQGGFGGRSWGGMPAMPGTYTATLSKMIDGTITELSGPVSFEVVPLREGALEGASPEKMLAFGKKVEAFYNDYSVVNYMMENSMGRVNALQIALSRADETPGELVSELYNLNKRMMDIQDEMEGNSAKEEVGERNNPTIRSRMFVGMRGMRSTYGPTPNQEQSMDAAIADLAKLKPQIEKIYNEDLPQLEQKIMKAGAPWIEGSLIPKNE